MIKFGPAGNDEKFYESGYKNSEQMPEYLNKMGADIIINERKLKINGPTTYHGEIVKATDLRAGACLILAALAAEGTTTITNVEYVLRGYENIEEKLTNIGAKIKIEEI